MNTRLLKSFWARVRRGLSVFFIAASISLYLVPATSSADIVHTIDEVFKEVGKITEELITGQDLAAEADIERLLLHWAALLQEAAIFPSPAWTSTQCPVFKGELETLFDQLGTTFASTGKALGTNVDPLHLDPLAFMVDKIPCPVLYPFYVVLEEGPLKSAHIIQHLIELDQHIKTIEGHLIQGRTCEAYDDAKIEITVAKYVIQGSGALFNIVGLILEASGKTIIAGPIKVEAGAMGFLDGGLTHNNVATAGKIFSGLGTVLGSISSAISDFGWHCELLANFETNLAAIATHDTDIKAKIDGADEHMKAKINAHDQGIRDKIDGMDTHVKAKINAHDEDIKALIAEMEIKQVEIIRLLLTPEGIRNSVFCPGGKCAPAN